MKILFINLNLGATPGINNGIAVLSSVLKRKNHDVKLLFISDELGYGLDLLRIKHDVESFNPGIIAFSLIETQLANAKKICSNLKEYYKGFLLFGGSYPSMAPEDVLKIDGVNAVCIGEGEDAILELSEKLDNALEVKDIKNLWFNIGDFLIKKNSLRPFIDIKKLPPEDKDLFDLEKLLPIKNFQLEMMVGRGCAYGCSYCINKSYIKMYKEKSQEHVSVKDYIRLKDIDTIIIEIKSTIIKHRGIKKIAFIDDNFIDDKSFLKSFCIRYKRDVGIPFMCNVNPMSFNLDKAKQLKDAGCEDIRFGVESGSERVKKDIMNRNISNESVLNAFKTALDIGLMTSSFNMIGLPTETKNELIETIKLNAVVMPDSVKFMTFYPFTNTPIYNKCLKSGLIDFKIKDKLDNYDTRSCLKFSFGHNLFLKKVQVAFSWYINSFLNNELSGEYIKLVENIEKMGENEWDSFDFYKKDREISGKFKDSKAIYYSSFVNRSLAVKSSVSHFNRLSDFS